MLINKVDKEQNKKGKGPDFKVKKVGQVMYKTSTEGVFVVNDKGLIQTVNPSIENMFGFQKNELRNIDIRKLIPEISSSIDCKSLDKKNNPTISLINEKIGIRENGEKFPLQLSCNHFDTEGHSLYMILVTDLTEVKQKEKKLLNKNAKLELQVEESVKAASKSEHLFRMIARNFPNGIIGVLDRELNFVYIDGMELHNSALGDQLFKGENFLQRIDPEIRFDIKKRLLSAFNGNQSTFELKIQRQTYLVNAVGIEVSDYNLERILIVTQNISSLKKAEREILKSLQKEKELNEVKSRFVAMASHEFQTPLTTILNSTTILSKLVNNGNVDKRAVKQIDRIKSTIDQLRNILEDILSLQQLEEGKMDAKYSEISLPEFSMEVLNEMKDYSKSDHELEYLHEGEEIAILDYQMLKNIYNNLISNAIKYSPNGEKITVKTSLMNNLLSLTIEDRGIGIPWEEQNHIFERFYRANNALDMKGTGLGLNIVRKYMEMVKGSIDFSSRPNKGTIFTVEIPLEIASVEIASIN